MLNRERGEEFRAASETGSAPLRSTTLDGDIDVKSIEHLDVTPTCDGAGCEASAAFGFFCRRKCGTAGVLCERHHTAFSLGNPWRKCHRCQITERICDLVIFFPLGSA